MRRFVIIIMVLVVSVFLLTACGNEAPPAESVSPSAAQTQDPAAPAGSPSPETKPEPKGTIDVAWETGAVTVEYYEGTEIAQTEQEGSLLIQVPQGSYLEKVSIYAPEGKVEIVGVLAAQYDIETVGHDIDIYLPEGTAFHVMLSTIRDIFESDFPYDVTMTKHEYIYLTDGVEITLETVIGVARVMVLQ